MNKANERTTDIIVIYIFFHILHGYTDYIHNCHIFCNNLIAFQINVLRPCTLYCQENKHNPKTRQSKQKLNLDHKAKNSWSDYNFTRFVEVWK